MSHISCSPVLRITLITVEGSPLDGPVLQNARRDRRRGAGVAANGRVGVRVVVVGFYLRPMFRRKDASCRIWGRGSVLRG